MSTKFTSILLFIFMCTFITQASQEEQIVMTVILPKSDSWVSIATDGSWEYENEIYSSLSEQLKKIKVELLAEVAKKAFADSFSSDEESESDDELDNFDDSEYKNDSEYKDDSEYKNEK